MYASGGNKTTSMEMKLIFGILLYSFNNVARRGNVEVSRFMKRAASDCLPVVGVVVEDDAVAVLPFVLLAVAVAVVVVVVVLEVAELEAAVVVIAVGLVESCAAFGSKVISE